MAEVCTDFGAELREFNGETLVRAGPAKYILRVATIIEVRHSLSVSRCAGAPKGPKATVVGTNAS